MYTIYSGTNWNGDWTARKHTMMSNWTQNSQPSSEKTQSIIAQEMNKCVTHKLKKSVTVQHLRPPSSLYVFIFTNDNLFFYAFHQLVLRIFSSFSCLLRIGEQYASTVVRPIVRQLWRAETRVRKLVKVFGPKQKQNSDEGNWLQISLWFFLCSLSDRLQRYLVTVRCVRVSDSFNHHCGHSFNCYNFDFEFERIRMKKLGCLKKVSRCAQCSSPLKMLGFLDVRARAKSTHPNIVQIDEMNVRLPSFCECLKLAQVILSTKRNLHFIHLHLNKAIKIRYCRILVYFKCPDAGKWNQLYTNTPFGYYTDAPNDSSVLAIKTG